MNNMYIQRHSHEFGRGVSYDWETALHNFFSELIIHKGHGQLISRVC